MPAACSHMRIVWTLVMATSSVTTTSPTVATPSATSALPSHLAPALHALDDERDEEAEDRDRLLHPPFDPRILVVMSAMMTMVPAVAATFIPSVIITAVLASVVSSAAPRAPAGRLMRMGGFLLPVLLMNLRVSALARLCRMYRRLVIIRSELVVVSRLRPVHAGYERFLPRYLLGCGWWRIYRLERARSDRFFLPLGGFALLPPRY